MTSANILQDLQSNNLLKMRTVSEVMQKTVIYVSLEATLLEIARMMAQKKIGSVAIAQKGIVGVTGVVYPLGIISEGDIVRFQAMDANLAEVKAEKVINTPLFCLHPTDSLWFALNSGGFLFLGKAEMLFSRNHLFSPLDLRQRVFTKLANGNFRQMVMGMASGDNQPQVPEIVDRNHIYEAAFEVDPVAQIVVDINGVITLANQQARSIFNINLKDIGRLLQDLEISYRPVELRSRIDQVHVNRHPVALKDIEWFNPERETSYDLDIQIIPLTQESTDELLGVKIIFTNVTRFKHLQQDLVSANQELETAYEELQSTNEELETTNEELQSTVEELETTNEELQSTNEELQTMNEEMQSTNEELQTMNEEMRQSSDELNRVNTFLESILTSLRSGVVVVNPELHILIWNRKAEDMWGLRFDEVFSNHFMSLDIGLPIEQLRQPLREILNSGAISQEVILNSINFRGKAIECQIILTPLNNSTSDIQGVILLMEERQQEESV